MIGDKKVVQCNYRDGDAIHVAGARAYVMQLDPPDRVRVLARSRSGRWIDKWEDRKRLKAFRFKSIPPDSHMHARLIETSVNEEGLFRLNKEEA